MKPLSQKLAELSVQAKTTEDHVATAQTEAREHIEQRREQVRQEAEQTLDEMRRRFQETQGEARMRLEALRAKINSDFTQLKKDAGEKKQKFETWRAENYASDKEADALAAIDYAIAATRLAELQTLDAVAARVEADSRTEQIQAPQPVA